MFRCRTTCWGPPRDLHRCMILPQIWRSRCRFFPFSSLSMSGVGNNPDESRNILVGAALGILAMNVGLGTGDACWKVFHIGQGDDHRDFHTLPYICLSTLDVPCRVGHKGYYHHESCRYDMQLVGTI